MLQSPQHPPTESLLTLLINEIMAVPDKFVLVLDDYHVIDANPVDRALTYLLEHSPPQMHLVIVTREDPNLPLARLRGRGQLTELRVTDLRFTLSEAAELLNQVMGLNLSAEDVSALETRTEGWIAGLQMAALSMQGRADTTSFIQAFAGSHHFVLDYLVEEVLRRQPAHVHNFLLQTSILDRLSGPLCNTVTRREDGKELLEALERCNLFVVPLDDERQWYRYHHLFTDVLQVRLMEEQPNRVPTLHGWASEWYEQNGSPADAIHHALAAEDFERTADLVELAWPAMDWSFQSATWLGWAKVLPDELVRARPVLSVGYAWALRNVGQLEAGEARLRDAERWLDTLTGMGERSTLPSAEMVVVDEEQYATLPVTIANARAYHAQALGDVPGSVKYARRALDLLPEGDHFGRGRAAVLLGLAYWASADLDGALELLDEAERWLFHRTPIPDVRPITALKTRVWVAQGRLAEALGWARKRGLSVDDELSYLREFEHLTLARALIAQYKNDQVERAIREATGLLERLLKATEEGRRKGSVIEILVLQALALEAQGYIPPALVPLERALTQAKPEGYIRIFVDEGRPMATLLQEAAKHAILGISQKQT